MMDTTRPLIVFVDVDDTFVRSVGAKRIPITRVIDHVKQLKDSGATLFCWSTGGAEYAQKSAEEFGIGNCFNAFLPKPHVMIDDQSVADWRFCMEVHPASIEHQNTSQYWDSIDTKNRSSN